jgi:16S rRNA (cytidine1402-2'-O)-methyltransferase
MPDPGTLYVVATPIGNLKDITLRALETLQAVGLIACEDTRQTAKLLTHYDIRAKLVSLHDHNERQRTPQLLERLKSGESIALVCDGGTPLISDPGWWLVHQAIECGVTVTCVPGPTALITGLVRSGLPTDRFVFEGFLPAKSVARRRRLEVLKAEGRTAVMYESPHRLVRTLEDIQAVFGETAISCSRELTKLFEETRCEPVSRMRAHFTAHPPKGEFVLVVPPSQTHDAHGQ